MAISSYERDGKTFWQVYLNLRSKSNPTLRRQRRMGDLPSEKAAIAEEKRLLREMTTELSQMEGIGVAWETVIDRWEAAMESERHEAAHASTYQLTTILDHGSCLRRWTASWLKRPASELNRGDAREVFDLLAREGKSREFQRKVKHTVNVIFDWGIEHRLIRGAVESPMRGIKMTVPHAEKVPDILTLEEIRRLLTEARRMDHPWYPIWAMALLTGMRNGELHALLWSDVDFENRRLSVSKSFHSRRRVVKSTKSGCWRTVPISDELFQLLSELKATSGDRAHVLPRFWKWDQGHQAMELRKFCVGIGIRSIRFHALRACFATQLLGHDIAPARVMKICGWAELKTMQRYIRMAGIEERGATQVLRFLPNDLAVMGEVVDLFEFKAKR